MDSNYKAYDHVSSADRMRKILNQADTDYTEADRFPDRERLTFTNGFYASCSALFIDIRGSSKLPSKYQRRTLARIYRAYLSEVVAVLNGSPLCREVNIVGDGAWSVYNTPYKTDLNAIFSLAAQLSSMIDILNYQLGRKGIENLTVGIGLDWGRALMVKAGYAGSGLNDVVYMGDVVNAAAKFAAHGNATSRDRTLQVSDDFRSNLNDHNQGLLSRSARGIWHGNVINKPMNEWYQENCQ